MSIPLLSMRATFFVHLILLDLFNIVVLGEEYKWLSSRCVIFSYPYNYFISFLYKYSPEHPVPKYFYVLPSCAILRDENELWSRNNMQVCGGVLLQSTLSLSEFF
jgi:hypothetical protein